MDIEIDTENFSKKHSFWHWIIHWKFARYSCVGIVNTIVIFGFFFLFNEIIGTTPDWANRFAYTGGLISNFTLNKLFTFKSRKFRHMEILLFLLSWGISYGFQFLVFRLLIDFLHWNENLAALPAYPLYGLMFYMLCRYMAFNEKFGKQKNLPKEENLN